MRNKIHFWPAFGFAFLVLVVTLQAAERQWLRYRTGRDVRQILGNIGSQQIELRPEKPAGVELPEFETDNPLFGKWLTPMVESGLCRIALDRTEKDGPYDRMFIDSNADGHLKDETAVTAYQKQWNRSNFGPVKVLFEVENEPVAYHLNFEFIGYNNQNMLYAASGGWYEGQVTVDGQKKPCTLIDQNANGTFNDTSNNAYECDHIVIGGKDDMITSFAGKEIVIGAVIYKAQIARDGSFIELAAAEDVVYGSVRVPETIRRLSVKKGDRIFTIEPEKGTGQLPLGQYRIQSWKIERKDEQGNAWVLTGQDLGSGGDLEISESKETKLDIGEPIVCTLQFRKSGSSYSFSQILRGRLGEMIELTRNGSQPQPPKLNIKNTNGSYDQTYRFEYG